MTHRWNNDDVVCNDSMPSLPPLVPACCPPLPLPLPLPPLGAPIQVVRDEDLREQIGSSVHFDLVDFEKVQSFRVQKQTKFVQFKVRVRV